ncbi:hypothetical protein [Paracoccus pantotrophus]|uniref:hypothetical protein n=1 Tax=Paracoccus pantotrophus TaxID=82367 RepID=UPI000F41F536|nr:hypothetical protein [Paracoccus pantotrophus]RNI15126.1 hypothetical protein EB844_17720 [Paracoccus pantotrophus]
MAMAHIVHPESRRKPHRLRTDPHGERPLYTSDDISASVFTAGSVHVDVFVGVAAADIDRWSSVVESRVAPASAQPGSKKARDEVKEAMKAAFAEVFSDRFSGEIDKVVDAYRVMLRESLAKGDDTELQAALNRARLQEKILAGTSMVDQAQACELLGLSAANPSATMKRKEEKREILRFTVDGRAVYPLFQFDVEGRRIYPAMAKLIALTPRTWSGFRLLHWLTRPHLDFGAAPAERLGVEADAVIAAFEREIVPAEHG